MMPTNEACRAIEEPEEGEPSEPANEFARFMPAFAAPDPEAALREERETRANRAARLAAAEIPLEPGMDSAIARRDLVMDTPAMQAAASIVTVARAGFRPRQMLLLLGDVGRGKTVAVAHMIAELGGAYVSLEEAIRLHRSRLAGEQHAWRLLKRARVLGIDELGLERSYVAGRLTFHELVDCRQELITVSMSNLSLEDLRERYDERTFDRFGSNLVPVYTRGPSFRHRRPWRVVFKFGELEEVDQARLEERYAARLEYLVVKGAPFELRVELAGCRRDAIADIRIAGVLR